MQAPWSWTFSLQDCEKYISVILSYPVYGVFVMADWADEDNNQRVHPSTVSDNHQLDCQGAASTPCKDSQKSLLLISKMLSVFPDTALSAIICFLGVLKHLWITFQWLDSLSNFFIHIHADWYYSCILLTRDNSKFCLIKISVSLYRMFSRHQESPPWMYQK